MAEKKAHNAKPSISSNTHWNVPDWKNAAAYPKPDDLDLTYWRWEFLRRRPDYREDFDAHAPLTYEYEIAQAKATSPKTKRLSVVSPDHPAFRARLDYLAYHKDNQADPAFHQALQRFLRYDLAYSGLPNPRCMRPLRLHFERPFGGFLEGPLNEKTRLSLREDQVMFIYCLSRPLTSQEKLIGDLLRKMQAHRYGRKVDRRVRKKDWPRYLRVLDAKNAGLTYHEIGRELGLVKNLADLEDEAIASRVYTEFYKPALALGINFPR